MSVPVVDYLVLDAEPHLVANECTGCRARYFGRRNGCARCGGESFTLIRVSTLGRVASFTIVRVGPPGADPFVAAMVDCEGTLVRANLTGIEPDPAYVSLGMPVRLSTRSLGLDVDGVEAITFGFEPVPAERSAP